MNIIRKIIFIVLALFVFSTLSKTLFEYRKNYSFYEEYRREYEQEKKLNRELKTKLVKTEDAHEFEKIVRNKLGLTKKGEVVMVVPEPTKTTPRESPTPIPPYKMWIDTFVKN